MKSTRTRKLTVVASDILVSKDLPSNIIFDLGTTAGEFTIKFLLSLDNESLIELSKAANCKKSYCEIWFYSKIGDSYHRMKNFSSFNWNSIKAISINGLTSPYFNDETDTDTEYISVTFEV